MHYLYRWSVPFVQSFVVRNQICVFVCSAYHMHATRHVLKNLPTPARLSPLLFFSLSSSTTTLDLPRILLVPSRAAESLYHWIVLVRDDGPRWPEQWYTARMSQTMCRCVASICAWATGATTFGEESVVVTRPDGTPDTPMGDGHERESSPVVCGEHACWRRNVRCP